MNAENNAYICKSCGKTIALLEKAVVVEGGLLCIQCEQHCPDMSKKKESFKKVILMPKLFFLQSIAVSGIILIFLFFVTVLTKDSTVAWICLFLSLLITIFIVIINANILYKAWYSIQDGNARTTPEKAVGFMFIPFFNIYWMFQAIWGFAKDYNNYIERYEYNVEKLPDNFFLTFIILILVGALANVIAGELPCVSHVLAIAAYIFWYFIVAMICDAVIAITIPPNIEQVEEQGKN